MAFQRKYNTLLVTGTTAIQIPMIKRGLADFAVSADWTPAAGDVLVVTDGAAVANITNLPTAVTGSTTGGRTAGLWEFILTAAELSGKSIRVMISDATTKAVEDNSFIVETFGNASAMLVADMSLANLPANVTQLLGTAVSTPATAGILDVNVKNIVNTTAAVDANNLLKVDAEDWKGGVIPAVSVTGVPLVDAKYLLGTIFATPATAGLMDVNEKKHNNVTSLSEPANFNLLAIDGAGDVTYNNVIGTPVDANIIRVNGHAVTDTANGVLDVNVKNINNVSANAVTTVKAVQGLAVDGVITTLTNVPANFTSMVITAGGLVTTTSVIRKNVALPNFDIVMTDSTTHAPKSGLGAGVTATRRQDGGAFGACDNAVAEVASGVYTINLTANDMNANKITLRFTAAASDDLEIEIFTQ